MLSLNLQDTYKKLQAAAEAKYRNKQKQKAWESGLNTWEAMGRPGADVAGAQQAVRDLDERGYDMEAPWLPSLFSQLLQLGTCVLIGGMSFGLRFGEVLAGKRAIHVCKAGINRVRANIMVSVKGSLGLHARL